MTSATSTDTVKPCATCRYFKATPHAWGSAGDCLHPQSIELITGEPETCGSMRIYSIRTHNAPCDTEGKLWEPRESTDSGAAWWEFWK